MTFPTLGEFLADPERANLAVAWDRDVPANYRWTTDDDGCHCARWGEGGHAVQVFERWGFDDARSYLVTNGHGSAFVWEPSKYDPLGGKWSQHSALHRQYRVTVHGETEYLDGLRGKP